MHGVSIHNRESFMKVKKAIGIVLCCAISALGGTFIQNLEFPETGLILEQRVSSGGVSTDYNAGSKRGVGQSFVLMNETTLSAITIQKLTTLTVPAGETNALALWIGEVSTNGVPGSTNYTGLIDLSDQSFDANSFCSVNLDSPVVLPAGRYAFQMQFTTEGENNNFSLTRSTIGTDGDPYADGEIMYGIDVVEVPYASVSYVDDLVFGLHNSAVSFVTAVAVDPSAVSLFLDGESDEKTGSVAVSYLGETDVDLTISITDQSHAGAFTLLSASNPTLVDPTPSNMVVEFSFDNSVAGLTEGQSATGLLTIAWSDQASGSGQILVPIDAAILASDIITLVEDVANSSEAFYGTSVAALLTDPFAYTPLDPTAALPALAHSDGFHGNNADGSDVVLSFTLADPYTTVANNPVIVADLWGRNSNQNRDDDLDVILYNGDYSTPVGSVMGAGIADGVAPYGRASINTLAVGTTFDRIQVIGHNSSGAAANPFTVTELRLASIPGDVITLVPVIDASTTSGDAPLQVIFDGSSSSSSEGVASYDWNFGDGNTASGVLVTNIYSGGDYTATLTVTDVDSNSAQMTVDISANITVVPVISASATTGAAPFVVMFDATESSSSAGIDSYNWDFGDGNSATGVLATNTYMAIGEYSAVLTVTAVNGNYASTSMEIVVKRQGLLATAQGLETASTSIFPENFTPFSTNDLAEAGQPTLLNVTSSGITTGLTNLNNGIAGDASNNGQFTLVGGNATHAFTYNLDLSENVLGYDITAIQSYAGWNPAAKGRSNQGYTMTVTYVDGTTEVLARGTHYANGLEWNGSSWDDVGEQYVWTEVIWSNTNTTGVIARGVKSITFSDFDSAGAGGVVAYREFDILGAPSIATENPMVSVSGTTMSWASGPQNYEIQSRSMLNLGTWGFYATVVGTPPENTFEMPVDEADVQFFRVILAD